MGPKMGAEYKFRRIARDQDSVLLGATIQKDEKSLEKSVLYVL